MARITRADRFRAIRDAVMASSHKMRPHPEYSGIREMAVGPFMIHFSPQGALGLLRGANMQIWPGGDPAERPFGIYHANKVANVDWWQDGDVEIHTYRSGPWEAELLSLLQGRPNVVDFDWHRRRHLGLPVL